MYPSQERMAHVGASLWQHLYRAQSALEKLGAADLSQCLPVLFAMYYYAVETIMQVPAEEAQSLQLEFQENVRNLAQEEYISPAQAEGMLRLAKDAAEEITRVYRSELEQPEPNPIRAIVKGASQSLGLDYGDVNRELALSLTDFVVMSTIHRKGGHAHAHEHPEGGEG